MKKKNDGYVKATSDIFIKYLFGSDDEESNRLVLSFINAVLEDADFPTIKKIIQKNPFNYRKFKKDKLSILDIKVVNEKDEIYNIEVQTEGDRRFPNRSLYYWARLYAGQLEHKNKYTKLHPVIIINIVNFTLFHELKSFHNHFILTEATNKESILTNHLILHFLELPKMRNLETSSNMEKWLLYLKKEGKESNMLKFLLKDDVVFEIAHRRYKKFIGNEKYRQMALDRDKAEKDRQYHLDIAEERGLQCGIEKGIEKGIAKGIAKGLEQGINKEKTLIAAKMIENDYPLETISEITGMTLSDIENIK